MDSWTVRRVAMFVLTPLLLAAGCQMPPEELVDELESLYGERRELRDRVNDLDRAFDALRSDLHELELADSFLAELDEEAPDTAEDTVRTLVRLTVAQLEDVRELRDSAQARVATLEGETESIRLELDQTASHTHQQIAEKETEITELRDEVTALSARVEGLEEDVTHATAELEDAETEASTVYYTIGTCEELLGRGILEKVGGARVILGLLWRRGETLVPSRDLDPEEFTAMDRRDEREIVLPDPDKAYRVVTRQNLAYAETSFNEQGAVRGTHLAIMDPERFWRASRFLILVEEEA